jgi:hypothetical protein
VHGLNEVAEHFRGGQYLFWQLHTKSTFEAEQELHPPQTVEAKITFQRTVECDSQGVVLMGVKLDGELLHNCEQRLRDRSGRTLLSLWLA